MSSDGAITSFVYNDPRAVELKLARSLLISPQVVNGVVVGGGKFGVVEENYLMI